MKSGALLLTLGVAGFILSYCWARMAITSWPRCKYLFGKVACIGLFWQSVTFAFLGCVATIDGIREFVAS
jgi:hypothetical protein